MKIQTLFRLGALATLLTALGYAIGEAIYLFGNAKTLFFAWYVVIVYVFQAFAYIALYVAQAKRGDIVLFIGFVISMIATLYTFMDTERRLALRTGLITEAQLEQAQQISSFAILSTVGNILTILGWVIFGYGVLRTGIFPRAIGMIMILTGVAMVVRDTSLVFEYAFAILSVTAYGWLGWALWKHSDKVMDAP
jgi:hypothetical protein